MCISYGDRTGQPFVARGSVDPLSEVQLQKHIYNGHEYISKTLPTQNMFK